MIGKQSVVAIIPAKGGSKGLPGKNIADLNGRPMIAYTIDAALKSKYIDRVVVSTDDEKIAKISRECGAEVPFLRPKNLAQDTTHTPPVIEHAVRFLEKGGFKVDIVLTLQPTSPLRVSKQIDEAITFMAKSRFSSVVSVRPTDYPPYWMVKVKDNKAVPFVDDGTDYYRKERQQLPRTYQINGAVYATRRDVLAKEKVVISRNCGAVVMDNITSLDVDTYEDLERINKVLQGGKYAATAERIKSAGDYYFYKGKLINLRGITKEDYTQGLYKWANDPEFNKHLSYSLRPFTAEDMEKLYEDLIKKENFIFTIVAKKANKAIGIIGLHHPNWHVRSAEYTVHIGEKEFWGTGVAAEATEFILGYAFNTLNMHKVYLGVNEANIKAVKFYEKMNFKYEGKLRDEIFRNNKYYGSIRMSILKEEYMKR